jgi:hypothetical protein
MANNTVRQRVLREALKRVGNHDEFAQRLGVSRLLLDRWLKRTDVTIPNRVFLTAVDILDAAPPASLSPQTTKPTDRANKHL